MARINCLVTCLKWEGAGSRAGLGAEGRFGQPLRNAGHLPEASGWAEPHMCSSPCPNLVCDSWMGLLHFLAYLIPGCQVTQ